MNIVYYSPSWPQKKKANGIVTYCANMLPALQKYGHRVFIITSNLVGDASEDVWLAQYKPTFFEKLYCKVRGFFEEGFPQYYMGSRAITHTLKKISAVSEIDIFEIEESFGWYEYIEKNVDHPVVLRLHGPHYINGVMGKKDLTSYDHYRIKREEKSFKLASYVNAPCQWIHDDVKNKYNLKWPISTVFYNPIKTFDSGQTWDADNYTPLSILFVGRFDAHKGGDIVLSAFSLVLDKIPDAKLIFVGPDRGVFNDKGERLGIHQWLAENYTSQKVDSVSVEGFLEKEEVENIRRKANLTVVASRNENFPYSVLEALASGSPLLATRVGGIAEMFEDGVSGIYCNGSDPQDMAEKIIDFLLYKNPSEFSEKAHERCNSFFSVEKISNQALDFYEKVNAHYNLSRKK